MLKIVFFKDASIYLDSENTKNLKLQNTSIITRKIYGPLANAYNKKDYFPFYHQDKESLFNRSVHCKSFKHR